MPTTIPLKIATLPLLTLLTLAAPPAQAKLFSLATSGTISENSSGDPTIPVGTPWSFELLYDTAAPDLDFLSTGSPDPTFGEFTNTASPPALTFFHYKAGAYEVTVNHPGDFGTVSVIETTFTQINGIDINIFAPQLFPQLGGGIVSFHADFAKFGSPHIFTSDALPTNTAIGPASFDDSNVTLLPPSGVVSGSNTLTSLTLSLAGDFSNNGAVNAADYVTWRKNLSTDPTKYTTWRANFGATLAAGTAAALASSESFATTAPEPTTTVMLLFGVLLLGFYRYPPRATGSASARIANSLRLFASAPQIREHARRRRGPVAFSGSRCSVVAPTLDPEARACRRLTHSKLDGPPVIVLDHTNRTADAHRGRIPFGPSHCTYRHTRFMHAHSTVVPCPKKYSNF